MSTKKLVPRLSKKFLVQFAKYNFGGFAFFWSSWAIITYGETRIGLFYANLAGNIVGISLNYLVQRYWAFGAHKPMPRAVLYKYIALTFVNFVISYFMLRGLKSVGIPVKYGQFATAAFFTGWNYTLYRLWVFRGQK
jgi:putative flippase GtrA